MTKPKVHANFQFDPERDLLILRDHLYEGSWELFLEDLRNRLTQRPMVYKISDNIHADIASIKALMREEGLEVEDRPEDFRESDKARQRKADEVYQGEGSEQASTDTSTSTSKSASKNTSTSTSAGATKGASARSKSAATKRKSGRGKASQDDEDTATAASADSPRVRRKQPAAPKSKSGGRTKSTRKSKRQRT